MVFWCPRSILPKILLLVLGIEKMTESVILEVIITDRLSFDMHIDRIYQPIALFEICTLIADGLSQSHVVNMHVILSWPPRWITLCMLPLHGQPW